MRKKKGDRVFFISDLHFGHANCIRFDNRPWNTVEEMDMELIKCWNLHPVCIPESPMTSGEDSLILQFIIIQSQ